MNWPSARRMPVLTAAPLPLVYGCRTTSAPASAARSPVASREPSSTTRISFHAASARRLETRSPIAASPLSAGITMETVEGSAKQPLHDSVPGDLLRAGKSCLTEPCRRSAVGCEPRHSGTDRRRFGRAQVTVLIIDDELERATGIRRGDHGLRTEERFECHVAVVLVEGSIDDSERAGVEIDERVAGDGAREDHALLQVVPGDSPLGSSALRALAGDDQSERRRNMSHCGNGQF